MGQACSTIKESDFGAKYYFNDIDSRDEKGNEVAPVNISNVQMEQRVTLSIELKNVDISSEHRVELITKVDDKGLYNKSAGFTERKSKDPMENSTIFYHSLLF